MLYIGHFSFDEAEATAQSRHGYFTVLTQAASAEAAADAFKTLIKDRKESDPIFEPIKAVYIEDILEFPEIPENPVITRLQSSAGEFPESVSHSLPGIDRDDIQVYGFSLDVKQIRIKPVHAYTEMTPFLKF